MIATLRRLLLISAGSMALSASGLAQGSADLQKTLSQAEAAYDRADYAEAVTSYRLAADQGHAGAQYNLGLMYAKGEGVPVNDAEAVRWYRLAADQGNASAQLNLGNMYAKGEGVPQNDVEAYKWWSLAAAQGHSKAAQYRDIVRGEMTPAQIAEAQRLAAAWKPNVAPVTEPSASPNKPAVASEVESTGSGFFLTVAGHLITNAHVVQGCSRVSLAGGSALTVLDIDASSDLALLKGRAALQLARR